MPQLIAIAVSTPSRHPAIQKGYDSVRHRYRPAYVQPSHWILDLFASLRGVGESSDGKPVIPANIGSLEWQVRALKGSFSAKIERKRSTFMLRTKLKVPEQGPYEITLRLIFADGTSESTATTFHLRDHLVVGIGDSFASGQGNPHLPAVPSDKQKLICRATSVPIVATQARAKLIAFAKK